MVDTELAWAAGFFDGEGSSFKTTHRRAGGRVHHYLGCSVEQQDRRPLERFAAAIGFGNVRGPEPRWGMHAWRVEGVKAHRAMELLAPYLSEPKREQYQAALDALEAECPA